MSDNLAVIPILCYPVQFNVKFNILNMFILVYKVLFMIGKTVYFRYNC